MKIFDTMNEMSFGCLVTVNILWLFSAVQLLGLQFVIVGFPDHTHCLNSALSKTFLI